MTKTINGITVATLTETQAAIVNQARSHSSADERKQIKREVFAIVKAKFGINETTKVAAFTKNPTHPEYLVLHAAGKSNPQRGKAFRLGADGRWDGHYVDRSELFPPPVQVEVPAELKAGFQSGDYDDDGEDDGPNYAAAAQEVGQSVNGFQGVATLVGGPAFQGTTMVSLPDGVKIVGQDSDTVLITFDRDEWDMEILGNNENRILLTRND